MVSKPNVIALAADAALFPAALFLACRLSRLNPRDDAEIVLFSDALPDLRAAFEWHAPCDLRHIESGVRLPASGRLSGAMFYRLVLPPLLGEAQRMVYLDTDTYVENDRLWRLFDLDMEGSTIGAVRDFQTVFNSGDRAEVGEVGEKYLNSGVMLVDAPRYVSDRLQDRFLEASIRTSAHDQRAINLVLRGEWLELSPSFNMTPFGLLSDLHKYFPPVVTHFMGPVKPWHGPAFWYDHPARAEMERFFPSTPWPRFLSRYFGFADAWHGGAPLRRYPSAEFVEKALAYMRATRFADVEQGITPDIRLR